MDILSGIKKRRSIREYKDKAVPRTAIKKIVDAARFAPTARNEQPWEFVAVTDKELLKRIASITDHGKFIAGAGACIAVFSSDTKYYLEDCSAAMENAMLEASSLKIGSCWVAGDKKPYAPMINQLLGVPEKYKLAGLVSLGYPLTDKSFRETAKRDLDEVLHWEKF